MIALVGQCGLERLAEPLRTLTGAEVQVFGLAQLDRVVTDRPDLVYVDLYGFDTVAPLTTAAVAGLALPVPAVEALSGVVAALAGLPVVYRGLRRPSGGAFGLLTGHPALEAALQALAAVVDGQRVLDVQALWARSGVPLDDGVYGLGHGEPGPSGVDLEVQWLATLWAARKARPVKCVVVDLDDTLIWGQIADARFHANNPAYLPNGETLVGEPIEAWWKLRRGLHEALRILRQRGIVLALASRNDPAVVHERFRKRPVIAGGAGLYAKMYAEWPAEWLPGTFAQHALLVDQLALGLDDFVSVQIGFGSKSAMCQAIADELGIGLDTLAFLDDSPFERAEVRAHAPGVLVLDGAVDDFRAVLLHGPRFTPWEVTAAAQQRVSSYTSRAAIAQAADPLAFLATLNLVVSLRPAVDADLARVRELLGRTQQLDLTGAKPDVTSTDGVWVGFCRDRLADHGLVQAAVVRDHQLIAWVCSCRVLPHRVAPTFLALLRAKLPDLAVVFVETGRNAASRGLVEAAAAGIAPWVRVEP